MSNVNEIYKCKECGLMVEVVIAGEGQILLSTLITECWKVCKKDGKRNLAPFMEKCNHLRKYLLAMCSLKRAQCSSTDFSG